MIKYEPVDLSTSDAQSIGLFDSIREARLYLKGLPHWQLWQREKMDSVGIFQRTKLIDEKRIEDGAIADQAAADSPD